MSRAFQHYPFQPESYLPVLPALVNGADSYRHRVAIVGGGIAGLATALGLAGHGVRSVVLEADESVCVGISPRNIGVHGTYPRRARLIPSAILMAQALCCAA